MNVQFSNAVSRSDIIGDEPMNLEPAGWGLANWRNAKTGFVYGIETHEVLSPDLTGVKFHKERQAVCLASLRLTGERKTEVGPLLEYSGSLSEIRKSFDIYVAHFTERERAELGKFEDLLPTIIEGWEAMLGLDVSFPDRPVTAKITLK